MWITIRRVTHFFYRFLIGRRYFATDFRQALEFILSNVFSICVQNFSRITTSPVIVLKTQLQIFFYKQTQPIRACRQAISYWTPSGLFSVIIPAGEKSARETCRAAFLTILSLMMKKANDNAERVFALR